VSWKGCKNRLRRSPALTKKKFVCAMILPHPPRCLTFLQKISLVGRIAAAESELKSTQEAKKEADKEQEDLLVFLEELSGKRRRDNQRMREAGLEVSDDEGEAEE
jgi:peptidoglycan hydrolase CwlO-like protein